MKPTKLTPLHRQAIDIAARVMWADAWWDVIDLQCHRCSFDGNVQHDGSSIEGAHELWLLETNQDMHSFEPYTRLYGDVSPELVAPPTPEYAKLAAALWLGRVERANGCPLPEIVEAARKADEARPDSAPFDTNEFFEVITYEALTGGEGWNWCDGHERFTVPPRLSDQNLCAKCDYSAGDVVHQSRAVCTDGWGEIHDGHSGPFHHDFVQRGSAFILPPLEFEYDEEEANRA